MHRHCGTNNRAPRWTFTDPCKPEVRPGAREEYQLVLRYNIPQVLIDNSYQANPGNSCSHAHFLSARRTKNTGLQGRYATLPRPYTRPADQNFHYEMDIDISLIFKSQMWL